MNKLLDIPPWLLATAILLVLVTAGLLYLHIHYRLVLGRLKTKILEVQDGRLEPLQLGTTRGTFLSSFVSEFNSMVTSLRALFSTVEECQRRVLNERNKINSMLQSLPGAVMSLDENLRIVSFNRQTEELFSHTQEDLQGQSFFEVLKLDLSDQEIIRDALHYKQPIRNQEFKIRMGAVIRWLSLNISFLNDQGNDLAVVVTLQDMTEYKQLQESVAYREKLVAMGQLAAGVAHELNTPLGNILGYSQLLNENIRNDDKATHFSKIIMDETKRCSRIVHDLLNYAHEEKCAGHVCDVATLVRDVFDAFVSCRAKRFGIDMRMILPPQKLAVEGACGQLDIVLTNLILNSMYALRDVEQPRIEVAASGEHDYVYLTVTDNGHGVPQEIRGRIFDPFFTTKGVGEGTGLGLSISQAMVSKYGGTIKYDSDYTSGARFIVKLQAVSVEDVSYAVSG
ncbi:MAG: PAS domain S-box protein [Gammaproteobacteria bacterium]|nr:PAS domain S-box protein [Gammaproteobacteria bacterium]